MRVLLTSLFIFASTLSFAQEISDSHIIKAEQMFEFVLQNQPDSLYANMSDKVKQMCQPSQFNNLLQQIELQAGKYISHSEWESQEIMGQKCYVSMAQFEQTELGLLIVFDENLKMLGIQFLPAEAVKKE